MSDWSSGYVTTTEYIFSYCRELNPLRCRLPLLYAGYQPPEIRHACELGFGQGLGTAIHAAGSVVDWWATDFHPAHAGFAQQLVAAFDGSARMFDQSFEEFCSRSDLPEFDFIGLHGVWSWISEENRRLIIDFVRQRLRVGGMLYLSYNTQPGWAARIPLRHLIDEHARVMSPPGNSMLDRVRDAFAFAEQLVEVKPAYMSANPQLTEQFHWIKQANAHYLAHEFFNRDWECFSFSRIAASLNAAKLHFAGSANPLDHLDGLLLTDEQQRFLEKIPDPVYQQTVRDFVLNQQFRQDYWIKGARRLSERQRHEALRQQRVMLHIDRDRVHLVNNVSPGEIAIDPEQFAPILDCLIDHRPKTIAELEAELESEGLGFCQLLSGILALMSKNILVPVQEDSLIGRVKPQTGGLNRFLLEMSQDSDNIVHLASPVTSGGVVVPRIQQRFLLAMTQGEGSPEALADRVWTKLDPGERNRLSQGHGELKEAGLAKLLDQARQFVTQLPRLRALGIV
ncbi:MAG: methyltransferase regulatory domain-containing protein [Magnetococcus sp. YQC-9]